jgi:hypothetical protein
MKPYLVKDNMTQCFCIPIDLEAASKKDSGTETAIEEDSKEVLRRIKKEEK